MKPEHTLCIYYSETKCNGYDMLFT